MKMKQVIGTMLAASVLAGSMTMAFASDMSKAGKALEYSTRKLGQNASITAHRVTGHNSVVKRHNGRRMHKSIITPAGDVVRMHHKHHMMKHM